MNTLESLCFMGKMCQFKISAEQFANIVKTFVQPCIISGLRQFEVSILSSAEQHNYRISMINLYID